MLQLKQIVIRYSFKQTYFFRNVREGLSITLINNYDSRFDRENILEAYAAQYAIVETDKSRLHMTTNAGSSRAHWFFVSAKEKRYLI